jgi:glycosyltransferase involved in cell wall biosynthesis
MPYISVIIPSYNRAHLIERAIMAVLGQSFKDWELLIVDDGSTDNTKAIIESYLNDQRIQYIYQNNEGVCSARNKGAFIATGEYLVFLDSDDFVESNWLEDFFDLKDNNYDILFCSMKIIKPNKVMTLVSCLDPYKDGKSKAISIPGSWLIKKSLFISIGMYDEKLKYGENTELRFRLNEEKPKIGIIDKFNFIYYESLDGGSKNLKNKIESNLHIIEKHPLYFKTHPDVLRFYYQNIAVAYVKLSDFKKAQYFFLKAFFLAPWRIKTLIRYISSYFPLLSKLITR